MGFNLSNLENQSKQEREAKLLANTSYYIKTYLNPNGKWGIEYSGKQRIDLVRRADVNWTSISDHIKDMNYQDFLGTPYWKAIAAYIKYRAGYRCQLCNDLTGLIAHHRDYSIHGLEHVYMHDLIALCNYCHQKFHDIEGKKTRSCDNASEFRFVVLGLIVLVIAYFLVLGEA